MVLLLLLLTAAATTTAAAPATCYCCCSNVRMLSAPAVLTGMIAQAALLGSKNSVTPLAVVLVCGAFNAVGDWYLVCVANMGIRGAAIATAASEFISVALLTKAVCELQYCSFFLLFF